jgi:uncharacterized protein (TIGR03790 family)
MYSRLCMSMLLLLAFTALLSAGGGPENVLVVMNARSVESLALGNAYRRARQLPYRNQLILSTSTESLVSMDCYRDDIETPIRTYLHNQHLDDTITQIVLTRGLPLAVNSADNRSIASLLTTMGVPKSGPASRLSNPYRESSLAFTPRTSATRGIYLVTVLHGYQLEDSLRLITQSLAAETTLPTGRFLLQTSPQLSRTLLKSAADLLTARGIPTEAVHTPTTGHQNLMGMISGGSYSGLTADFIRACDFRPGAIACLAQGFSAAPANFDPHALPTLVPVSWFIQAGITGMHGTLGAAEVRTLPAAFPQLLLDRYTRGFSLAESFFATLPSLTGQDLILGDPLCTPYARRPLLTLVTPAHPTQGFVPVQVTASTRNPGATINRLELFLDEQHVHTIYAPASCRVLVRVGDEGVFYSCPSGATVATLLSGLAEAINASPVLSRPSGVRAVPLPENGTLRLVARTPGIDANATPISMQITSPDATPPSVSVRLMGDQLVGGGISPTPARAALSFTGRRIAPGDAITLQLPAVRLTYTPPADDVTLTRILDDLVNLVNTHGDLQGPTGIRALRASHKMPVLILEARTPGDEGNQLTFHASVTPAADSQLRVYPDTPARLRGGHDGSAASLDLQFTVGVLQAQGVFLLDTTTLADGAHRLRAVAVENSPLHTQGWTDTHLQVANHPDGLNVTLPPRLGPASGAIDVPVTASPGVTRLDLFVDGQLLATAQPPFAFRLSLAGLGPGTHDLWAVAYDAVGNRYNTPLTQLEITPYTTQ